MKFLVPLLLLMIGCSFGGRVSSPTPIISTVTVVAYATATPPPVDTDRLLGQWRQPIASGLMLTIACDRMLTSAKNHVAGQIDDGGARAGMMGAGLVVGMIDEQMGEADFPHKVRLQADLDLLKPLIKSWVDREITSETLAAELAGRCAAFQTSLEAILQSAQAEGLPPDAADRLMAELKNSLESDD